ncbi:MAG TPA: gluconate 2-dehydrogenase subunit 3 family protein [Chitinophagaceae bacterium]
MDRREALHRVTLLLGGTILGANAFLTGCRSGDVKTDEKVTFSETDIAYMDEIAETILPATQTPGAKAAKVGSFMAIMVTDCYVAKDQRIFYDGLEKLNEASKKKYNATFMNASPQQRHELLVQIDKEVKDEMETRRKEREANEQKEREQLEKQKESASQTDQKSREEKRQEKPKEDPPRHYFRMMKELTLLGYFTSEVGQKQALRYNPVPGRYEGCVPYTKGEKAWA